MYQNIPTKVLTGKVRLSYVHLTAPYAAQPGQEPKYSATLLIPKSDTATYNDICQSWEAAKQAAIGGVWQGVCPPQVDFVLHDGDGVRPSGVPFGPECKGHWVMTASSKMKPQVVHVSNLEAELAPSDIYSGMYARVTVNFYGYFTAGRRGVGCGLGNVMKLAEGDPLGGGASAASDFAGLQETVPAGAPAYTPSAAGAWAGGSGINPITGQPM